VATNALDKKSKIKILIDMHMVKKSRKRSRKTPDVLAILLTGEQKSIPEHDVAKFEIVGIEVKGIPNLRVRNQPVHEPPPPSPVPSPTPTPPPQPRA
jgi:hypothetical protein